jgi:transposase-like protein
MMTLLLNEAVKPRRNRELKEPYANLSLDVLYPVVCENRRIVHRALVIAIVVQETGE